jgi:hypothetical protein
MNSRSTILWCALLAASLFIARGAIAQCGAGSNYIDDSDFSDSSLWSTGSGWTIAGGEAIASGASGNLSQFGIGISADRSYEVTFEVRNRTGGNVRIELGGTDGTPRSSNGTFVEVITAATSGNFSNSLKFDARGSGGASLVVDNVRVRRVDIIDDGDFSDSPLWSTGSGWTIAGGEAVASGASGNLTQGSLALTSGRSYELRFEVRDRTGGNVRPKLGGTDGTARSSNGTFVEVITAGSSNNLLQFDARGSGGASLVVDNVQLSELGVNCVSGTTDPGAPPSTTPEHSTELNNFGSVLLGFEERPDEADIRVSYIASAGTMVFSGARGYLLAEGLTDNLPICKDCVHIIVEPLDDYGERQNPFNPTNYFLFEGSTRYGPVTVRCDVFATISDLVADPPVGPLPGRSGEGIVACSDTSNLNVGEVQVTSLAVSAADPAVDVRGAWTLSAESSVPPSECTNIETCGFNEGLPPDWKPNRDCKFLPEQNIREIFVGENALDVRFEPCEVLKQQIVDGPAFLDNGIIRTRRQVVGPDARGFHSAGFDPNAPVDVAVGRGNRALRTDEAATAVSTLPVQIDVFPGSCPKTVPLSQGTIKVGIVGTQTFDAAAVNLVPDASGEIPVRLEGVAAQSCRLSQGVDADDCNSTNDGIEDVVCHFDKTALRAELEKTYGSPLPLGTELEVVLTGELLPGVGQVEGTQNPIRGTDVVVFQ